MKINIFLMSLVVISFNSCGIQTASPTNPTLHTNKQASEKKSSDSSVSSFSADESQNTSKSNEEEKNVIQTEIPALKDFSAGQGTKNGFVNFVITFPDDVSQYGLIKVIQKIGKEAPSSCSDGDAIKKIETFSAGQSMSFELDTGSPNAVFSYRACVYGKGSDQAIVEQIQVVAAVKTPLIAILTSNTILNQNSCDVACKAIKLTCTSVGIDPDAKNNVIHVSQGSEKKRLFDSTRCEDYYGKDIGGSCEASFGFPVCMAAAYTNCRCEAK